MITGDTGRQLDDSPYSWSPGAAQSHPLSSDIGRHVFALCLPARFQPLAMCPDLSKSAPQLTQRWPARLLPIGFQIYMTLTAGNRQLADCLNVLAQPHGKSHIIYSPHAAHILFSCVPLPIRNRSQYNVSSFISACRGVGMPLSGFL